MGGLYFSYFCTNGGTHRRISMKPKERLAIPRQQPKELTPEERIKNFDEVVSGFDKETAIK